MRQRPRSSPNGVYRLLLFAYPAEFRREYGAEMARFFDDRCREIAGAEGGALLWRFWLHILCDLAVSASAEHREAFVHRRFPQEGSMTGKRVIGGILLLGAAANIVYDAVSPNAMGVAAILLTALAAVGGALLVVREKPALPSRT